jgi:hypothetical protein
MQHVRLSALLRPIAGAAFATVVVASTAGAASPAGFSDPVKLIDGTFRAIDAARDGEGHLHIAAETATGSIVYLTDRTGTLTKRVVAKVVPDDKRFVDPTIALDGADRVHIAFTSASDGGLDCGLCPYGVMLVSDKGRARGTFPAPVMIGKPGSFAPDLAIRGGKRYLAFMTGMVGLEADPGTLWLKTDASGSWTTRKAATGIGGLGLPDPSIAVTSTGKARIAFEDEAIKVASASTRTGSFSVDTVTGTTAGDRRPVMLVNASDGPVVLFVSDPSGSANDGVFLRAKGGGSWGGVKVTGRTGAMDAVLDGTTIMVLVGGTTAGTAGTWWYAGPSFPEAPLGTARVRDVALAGVDDALFSRATSPRGIHHAAD